MRDGEVVAARGCRLVVEPGSWQYAEANASAIAAHWEQVRARNSGYFNGAIQVLVEHRISDDVFTGKFVTTDFASFVYWRGQGHPEVGAIDCFGCAIIRAADGALLLGVQSGGNLNSGRAYCPGGFIDPADVAADGTIDIDGSVAREVSEETGLDAGSLHREPGYLIVSAGSSIAIGITYRSALGAEALRSLMIEHLRGEDEPELSDILIVRSKADIEVVPSTSYVPALVKAIL